MSLLFCIESIHLICSDILYKRSYIVYFEVTLYTGTLIFLFCELFYVLLITLLLNYWFYSILPDIG